MNKIFMCGYFAFKTNDFGGQPVKTRETYYALVNKFGNKNIYYLDTLNWKQNPYKFLKDFFKLSINSSCLIMFPAHNGLKIYSMLLLLSKTMFKKKIYYDVIGGWLPEATQKSEKLKKRLLKFDGIWVETNSMKEALEAQGFKNISIVPNFKNITPLKEDELIFNTEKPFKFCYFARVAKEKGIEDAVRAITEINKKYGKNTATLDIYGQVNPDYEEGFKELQKSFDGSINYKGVVKPEKSVETLKDYFALLFPTKFYTEGIPGTIIDAYAAGIPVISSEWQSCHDVVEKDKTGIVFNFGNYDEFFYAVDNAVTAPQKLIQMKPNCLRAAEKYQPQNIAGIISYLLNLGR